MIVPSRLIPSSHNKQRQVTWLFWLSRSSGVFGDNVRGISAKRISFRNFWWKFGFFKNSSAALSDLTPFLLNKVFRMDVVIPLSIYFFDKRTFVYYQSSVHYSHNNVNTILIGVLWRAPGTSNTDTLLLRHRRITTRSSTVNCFAPCVRALRVRVLQGGNNVSGHIVKNEQLHRVNRRHAVHFFLVKTTQCTMTRAWR